MERPGLEVLIPEDEIRRRVDHVARRIEDAYRGLPLTVVGVLKGSVFFLVDLLRHVDVPLQLEFLRASSYGDATVSSGRVKLGELHSDLRGRHVLVVDDILDSGRTLAAICAAVRERGPESVRTCVLVDKRKPRAVEFQADFKAFDIPDVFIVGYGLDFAEQYRNLPYIGVLDPSRAGHAGQPG